MTDPVVVEDQSITTAGKQKLVIDRKELDKMSGKRVLVWMMSSPPAAPCMHWKRWPPRAPAR